MLGRAGVTETLNNTNGTEGFVKTAAGEALQFNLAVNNIAFTAAATNLSSGFTAGSGSGSASGIGSFTQYIQCTAAATAAVTRCLVRCRSTRPMRPV